MMDSFRGLWTGRAVSLVAGVLVLAACAPSTGPSSRSAGSEAQPAQPTAPKTLRVASVREPVDGVVMFSGSGDILKQLNYVFHAGLTVYDAQGNLQPRLATKVPRVEDGDWKVLPDGGMEVTWKLKPNLKWHDGTALTAEDFVFGIQLAKDPQLPLPHTGGVNLVREVTAPDADTLHDLHVRRLRHRIRRLDEADETFRFNQSNCTHGNNLCVS